MREGILLERDNAWAEASPLPGFSNECIDDVIAALRGEQAAPASLEFALTALQCVADVKNEVPFNHLLLGDSDSILRAASQCTAQTCCAVKIKVGQRDVAADVSLVKQLRDCLPAETKILLDANQTWEFDEAVSFCTAIEGVELEYIEEPLQNPMRLESLFKRTGIRYALDETLLHHITLERWPNAEAMICKPTILGGRQAIERLAATHKPIVFSAAFESGIGVARIVQLASEYSPGIPAGIDTLDWLSDDLLLTSPQRSGGMLVFKGVEVNTESLERIEL